MSNEISLRRKVTVYNTSAQNNKVLESAATTWGQLQVELAEIGIPYSGMRAVIGETQTELITDQSSLDPGNMTLFLMPRKVKSGIDFSAIVDPSNGVSFSDEDWSDEDPEDYTFKTLYDAGMAFLARANHFSEQGRNLSEKAEMIFAQWVPSTTGLIEDLNDDDSSDDDYSDIDNEPLEEEGLETSAGIWTDGTTERRTSGPYPTDNDWGFELSVPLDPEVERLKKQAEELQRNMR